MSISIVHIHSIFSETCSWCFLSVFPLAWVNLVYAVFLCDHTTGCEAYSFMTDGYGIFNVRTNLGACSIYTKWGQAQTSLYET